NDGRLVGRLASPLASPDGFLGADIVIDSTAPPPPGSRPTNEGGATGMDTRLRPRLRSKLLAKLDAFQFGDLKIEPMQTAAGEPIHLYWRGRSMDRHPARTVVPYVVDVIGAATLEHAAVRLHFETIEHMNSSTITALIQIIQEARSAAT